MSTETIICLSGILSGLLSIIFYFRWMMLYSRNKGYTIAGLFNDRTYKPFKIDEDKELTDKDRKRLNRLVIYFYSFFMIAFLIAFVANMPIVKGEE